MKSKLTLFLIVAILFSCSPRERDIPVVDLTNRSDGRLLHLRELMTDNRVVPLETNKEALVPQRYMSFVGRKYILILSDKNILQFNADGHFIRILARQGKGPGEYHGIFTFDVDDNESQVYIHHWGDAKRILGYELETGEPLPEIKLPNWGLSRFTFTKDHVLVVNGRSSGWELFTTSYQGEILDTLSNSTQKSYQSYSGRGKYLKRLNDKIFYMNELSDSLYMVDGVNKSAVLYFEVDNQYDFDTNPIGNLVQVSYQSESQLLMAVMEMYTEKIDQGVSTKIEGTQYYLWNNQAQTIEYLSGFYHDFFELNVDDFPKGNFDDVFYLEYSALDFKELLTKALENKELDPKKVKEFRELDDAISEDDNPVYLVGRVVQ